MPDIAENLGLPNILTIKDKDYAMKPLTVKELGMIQADIKKQKVKDWLEIAKEMGLSEEEKAKELKSIMNSSVSDEETFEFMDTIQGQQLVFYYVLRDNPGVTKDSIGKLMTSETLEQLRGMAIQEIDSPSEDRAEASA